jgi:hypothetical protein
MITMSRRPSVLCKNGRWVMKRPDLALFFKNPRDPHLQKRDSGGFYLAYNHDFNGALGHDSSET